MGLTVLAALGLPARQRTALILCDMLDRRPAEVADLLGTRVAAVNSALQRGRLALKDRLGPERRDDWGAPGGRRGPDTRSARALTAGVLAL